MMLVLVSLATHIWEMLIPGGGVHCHWKEPSLATVQERLAADTTLSGPGGTGGSMEGGCRNVMLIVGRATNEKENWHIVIFLYWLQYMVRSLYICFVALFTIYSH